VLVPSVMQLLGSANWWVPRRSGWRRQQEAAAGPPAVISR